MDYKCKVCSGKGYKEDLFNSEIIYDSLCRYCMGTGRADWLKNICGNNKIVHHGSTMLVSLNLTSEEFYIDDPPLIMRKRESKIFKPKTFIQENKKEMLSRSLDDQYVHMFKIKKFRLFEFIGRSILLDRIESLGFNRDEFVFDDDVYNEKSGTRIDRVYNEFIESCRSEI